MDIMAHGERVCRMHPVRGSSWILASSLGKTVQLLKTVIPYFTVVQHFGYTDKPTWEEKSMNDTNVCLYAPQWRFP